MPRSANSKIGAFASLLTATMFSEACHADLVLDRAARSRRRSRASARRSCRSGRSGRRRGTSRRRRPRASPRPRSRARAPPRARRRARSPRRGRGRGRRRRGSSAPSMSTFSPRCSPRVTIRARVEKSLNSTVTSSTAATCGARLGHVERVQAADHDPDRRRANSISRDRRVAEDRPLREQPAVAHATPVTSIATPAPSRAARPAPISNPSRPPPNSA